MVKAIHEILNLDKRVGLIVVALIATALVYLPLVLLILNLSIFVSLHVLLVVFSSLILVVLPQVYLFFYYHVMKHFENSTTFDKINRLVILDGALFSILIGIGIGFIIFRYGGLL